MHIKYIKNMVQTMKIKIKKIAKKVYLKKKNIIVDSLSNVPKSLTVNKGSKSVRIINSNMDHISMGEGCKLINCNVRGNVELGRFVSICGPGTRLSSAINKIIIGNFVSIAQNVDIQEFNHRTDKISSYFMARNIFDESLEYDILSKGDIIIEDDVWIGSNCSILSGVTIGRGSIVGAGSVVAKDLPPYSIAVGTPAKVIKKRFSEPTIEYIESLQWWQWDVDTIIKNKELLKANIENYVTKRD